MSRRLTNHYIHSHVHLGCVGVMLELGLETQSIRQAPLFQQLALDLCLQIAARDPQDVPDLLQQAFLKDPRKSVGNHLHDAATDLQEHVEILRFVRWEAAQFRKSDELAPFG